jgi:hypothetical protein
MTGAVELNAKTIGISDRLEDMAPLFEREITRLQESEVAHFAALGGRFVRTGALRASLTTQAAPGAIRRVEAHHLEFGSAIYYAPFQVEHPGPPTPAGGLQRRGHPSAVLELTEQERRAITEDMGSYVMGSEL